MPETLLAVAPYVKFWGLVLVGTWAGVCLFWVGVCLISGRD